MRRRIRMDGDPVLREVAHPVEVFDESLLTLCLDMIETMQENDGIGLAANQVGVPTRIIVLGVPGMDPRVMVNPVIVEAEDTQRSIEGCLSVPRGHWNQPVTRPKRMEVEYQDTSGSPHVLKCSHQIATVISHEIDHLDGILFTDKIDGAQP